MNIKLLFICIVLLLLLSDCGNATIYEYFDSGSNSAISGTTWYSRMTNGPTGTPYTYYGRGSFSRTSDGHDEMRLKVYDQDAGWIQVASLYFAPGGSKSGTVYGQYSGNGLQSGSYNEEAVTEWQAFGSSTGLVWSTYIMIITGTNYTISGSIGCIDNSKLYIYNNTWKLLINNTVTNDSSYIYEIVDGHQYKIVFDDHSYEFTVDGANINYDYNNCITTSYNFKESCGNLISDSEGFYIEKTGSTVINANNFYTSSGILNIMESPANNIYVSASPFSGQIGWFLDPIVNDTTYTLTNLIISWSLKVIVQNESTGDLINDAMVRVNQSCYCTDGYSVRQKMTINGHADFIDMSLQDAGLFVMKTGYKILDETSTGYSTFLSGRANFSSKTWIVKLAPSWSENESTFYESNNTVNIFFKNEDGNRTSKILDTDSQVYLYYENNNTDKEDMTLKFQSSSTHTHFIDEQSWNIPYDEIGHKTIANTYFTPWDYSYRAVIYNSSIYGWNMTIPLTVRNATKEENQHYENLSTDLWFMYADAGKIDYRNDMNIGVHACSNNTTLMNTDIELYKDNVLLCYKNMTASNFINADFPYYYVWGPAYSYESGSNYSVRMYGFDRTLLETNYVDCYTDDVTRKNKLTIIVKNHYGINLDNAFVYLEDYGSIPTGINYYASFEGLDNGYYRFKATKPNYAGTGWDDITLSDSDEIVTYTLTATDSEEGSAMQPQKVNENELQNIYLIIMAFLLIFIIIGGLKYAL